MTFRVVHSVETDLDRIVPRLESSRPGLELRVTEEFLAASKAIETNPWFFR